MKGIRRRTALLLMLLAATWSGCSTATSGGAIPLEFAMIPGRTTKAQIYRALGIPDRIRHHDSEQVLVYSLERSEGMSIGVRSYGLAIMLSNHHRASDSLEIVLGPDHRFRSYRFNATTPVLRRSFWPFG